MLKRNGAGLWAGKANVPDELLLSGIVMFPRGESHCRKVAMLQEHAPACLVGLWPPASER